MTALFQNIWSDLPRTYQEEDFFSCYYFRSASFQIAHAQVMYFIGARQISQADSWKYISNNQQWMKRIPVLSFLLFLVVISCTKEDDPNHRLRNTNTLPTGHYCIRNYFPRCLTLILKLVFMEYNPQKT